MEVVLIGRRGTHTFTIFYFCARGVEKTVYLQGIRNGEMAIMFVGKGLYDVIDWQREFRGECPEYYGSMEESFKDENMLKEQLRKMFLRRYHVCG